MNSLWDTKFNLNFFLSMNGLKKPKCTVLTGYKTNSVSIKITVFIFKTKKTKKIVYTLYSIVTAL